MIGSVYFIRSSSGEIKIGFTSGNVKDRLGNLQTSTPHELSLLLSIRGDIGLEAHFHEQFAEYRIKGEWFEDSPELFAFIIDTARGEGYEDGWNAASIEFNEELAKLRKKLQDHEERISRLEWMHEIGEEFSPKSHEENPFRRSPIRPRPPL